MKGDVKRMASMRVMWRLDVRLARSGDASVGAIYERTDGVRCVRGGGNLFFRRVLSSGGIL